MALQMKIGLDAISSYKRLAYTAWHAIAEFIDNSTQAYFDNKEVLDKVYKKEDEMLEVSVNYDRDNGVLRISDNSMGMSYKELEHALHVANPPKNTNGRSKYGMGMKTASCWLGNKWTIKTKKLGEDVEHNVTVDVEKISQGDPDLEDNPIEGKPKDKHYTIVEITELNRKMQGRTISKIKNYLRSMYRQDFRNGDMELKWQGDLLTWEELDDRLLKDHEENAYKKEFIFEVNGKTAVGWVGILEKGSRADAGFSILHSDRVVKGWPDAWRPSSLYGQIQGTNDLINQRLIGEIHLDEFDVSHTKDDILWLGDEEEKVEEELAKCCSDYREKAKDYRKGTTDVRGPSTVERDAAVDEIRRELQSPEIIDKLTIENVPSDEVIEASAKKVKETTEAAIEPTLFVTIGRTKVKLYISDDMSPNDFYVTFDSTKEEEIVVIVNTTHPHWAQLKGSEGVANYLRHCIYDAIAEWQARHKTGSLNPATIKALKDNLLRLPFEIERDNGEEE